MKLHSTNYKSPDVDLKTAVLSGMPSDNGLYMPSEIKKLSTDFIQSLPDLSFKEIAFHVSQKLIGDVIPDSVLEHICSEAINFDAPLVEVEPSIFSLELFHGPTLAFKDFGARFMSRLMAYFLQDEHRNLNILVATSGDTGGAVANGFYNVPGIHVTILYPSGKVSFLQEKQLTTLGGNISALEINGSFDDCQALVKQAFLDQELQKKFVLSSANSINIARLIPQSFYYFHAYAQLKRLGNDKPVVVSVPSGNFGNLCGGLFAKNMGLPIDHFIAATNSNNTFTEFLKTAEYKKKKSVQTISNAMDVGDPSNFVRLYELYNKNIDLIRADIFSQSFTDEMTKKAMLDVYKQTGYILDPHGAVGYLGLKSFMCNQLDSITGIFLETAHPSKFIDVVEETIGVPVKIPKRLKDLEDKKKVVVQLDTEYRLFKDYLMNHLVSGNF